MTGKIATLITAVGLSSLACDVRTPIGAVPDGAAATGGAGGTGGTVGTIDASADAFTSIDAPGRDLGGASSGGTCSPLQLPGDQPFTIPAGVEGTWTGFVQGGSPGLSSDAIKLILDHAADGSSQIHVAYGTAAPPSPATSATELYPPGLTHMQIATLLLFEGFPYLAHNVRWQPFGQQWRLTFQIVSHQGWESWCRLQTSYSVQGSYNCVPGAAEHFENPGQADEKCFVDDAPGGQVQVACAQAHLCDYSRCTCDACGCDGSSYTDGAFDLLFDGDSATGGNVRLMRAAN